MTWKLWSNRHVDGIIGDADYLVSYKDYEGSYSNPIRAYYVEDEDAMFPMDSSFAFPLNLDIYMKMPEVPK